MNPWIVKLIEADVPKETAIKFFEYHMERQHIWKEFEKFALKVVSAGKKIGAKAIVERIRWEVEIEQCGEFKVSNSYTAYYARIFQIKYPQYADIFTTNEVKGLNS